ncbi:50S ribosomal protein L25 [Sulfuriferula plumbiphila]|uniref:Large ribosomal subunit protein bL25 n=1 Tax=Sulfuriferula plumbiphila TaxID=171865 RepID=A0A512L515_9PROT|nr:50S ribosomal protein L25/general stress protein Ctc [Sulfuriferula plumbiphila]BBP03276.1 50S ribosomal protein L25 [Sulfuriferula plumbiphila]GEP29563.1 50S ribosomal protein L25 [Sulfuriferula plumbiphila]
MEVIANTRDVQGKGASRRLRRQGKTPGVVYGGGKDAVNIELDHNALFHALKRETFHASILTLAIDGAREAVLLRDYIMHPFRMEVQHIDFQRVDKTQKIHVKVPLHFINADIAPGVKLAAGVVTHIMTDLDVSCLADNLPEFIAVDLADLQAGHSIHLSELKLPAGVEAVSHRGDDSAVVTIVVPRGAVAEEAAETAVAPAAMPPAA